MLGRTELDYWHALLVDAPVALDLPTDRPRHAHRRGLDARVPVALSPGVRATLAGEAHEAGTSECAVVLSVFAELLARHTGVDDLVLRTAIDGVEGVQRIRRHADEPLGARARRLGSDALAARFAQAPFDDIVRVVAPPPDDTRAPVSQVLFAWNVPSAPPPEALELGLSVWSSEDRLEGDLLFDSSLFELSTVERLARQFVSLLDRALALREARLGDLACITAEEADTVVHAFNRTGHAFDASPVHAVFGRRAAERPDAIAIVATDGAALTYADVARRSDVLAARLRELGADRTARVGLWLPRSPTSIVASLAVLKTGAAYVPLETKDPHARIERIVADARITLVVGDGAALRGAELDVPLLRVDDPAVGAALESDGAPPFTPTDVGGSDAAYVIYTSGTTGTPNGVVIEHRSLANLIAEHVRLVDMARDDRVSQMGSAAFDASMCEIWSALTVGAAIVIVDDEVRLSPAAFLAWLIERRVTVSGMPTILAEALLDLDASASVLRWVTTGGATLRRRPRPGSPFRLLNSYGPTEATVYVTAEEIEPGEEAVRTIGRPIRNTTVYVLDASGAPTPLGVYGEIYVGGVNVGRGYFDRPTLTASRFVPDPFATEPGARLYRTGDVGRWRSDGRLEFAGRLDHQVKIRGFRVELGEIEAALAGIQGVDEAVVLAREDQPGELRLVGYVVSRSETPPTSADLRAALRAKLPDHMVPTALVMLAQMPTTTSGKVDRRSLPPPAKEPELGTFIAPRTPTEATLAEIWRRVLEVPRVGASDDFFELGGHSMLAAALARAISDRLGVQIALADVYDAPTLEKLATIADGATSELAPPPIEASPRDGELTTSFFQDAVLAFETGRSASPVWTEGARMTMRGRLDAGALREAVEATLERFDVLREVFDLRASPKGARVATCAGSAVPFERVVARGASSDEIAGLCTRRVNEPFAMDGSPLVRFALVEVSDDEHVLVATFHASIQDPMRPDVLMLAVAEEYAALRGTGPRPPATLRYSDFACWERAWFDDLGRAHVHAARRRIEGALPLDLARRPRGPRGCTAAHDVFVSFEDAFATSLFELCRVARTTHFMALTGLVAGALARIAGVDDVCLASPVCLRSIRPELERMPGRFLNWVPLRVAAPPGASTLDRVHLGREAALAAAANQVAPATLVYGNEDLFDAPLCRVILNMPVAGASDRRAPSKHVGDLDVDCRVIVPRSGARSDLAITLLTTESSVRCRVRGQADLFEARDVEALAASLKTELEAFVL